MLFENLKEYFVDDLLYENTKVIFVLESPHTQEVKNGYPVAGKSGNDMSKVLFGRDDAFGKLIHEQEIKNIGILNVSNYPLQNSAYSHQHLSEIEFFEKIRQNPKLRKYDKLGINPIVTKIMSDFKARLQLHRDKKIVLCGNFAQNSFDTQFMQSEFSSTLRVPHPSFNNWKKEKYKSVIQELLKFIAIEKS
jgi:hypothetical protein